MVSKADWGLAVEREAVIRPLAEEAKLSADRVHEAMLRLNLGRSALYKLIGRYRRRPQTSSLPPWKRGEQSKRGSCRLTRKNSCNPVLPHAKTLAIHPYRAAAQGGRLAMRREICRSLRVEAFGPERC